jgi:hypothetical protein
MLLAIRIVHTMVWAFFAACILWIPVTAWQRDFRQAALLIGLTMVEVVVLGVNRFTCPLTDLAARYTSDRRANFDIFLPVWLARYNKVIFGTLFVIGIVMTLAQWRGWRP